MAIWTSLFPVVDHYLHLTSPIATLLVGVWLVGTLQVTSLQGVLLGYQRFSTYGVGLFIGNGLVRLVLGVVLAAAGVGITGPMLATTVGSAVTCIYYAWNLRDDLRSRSAFFPNIRDMALSVCALSGAALLGSIDVWLARHFLSGTNAGIFAAAATAGRLALFLPGVILSIYFPRLAQVGGRGPTARAVLLRCTGAVGLTSFVTAGIIAMTPRLTVDLLFGSQYGAATAAISTIAAADALIAVANCFVYYEIAGRRRTALVPWCGCGLAIVLTISFHRDPEIIALDMLSASVGLLLVQGLVLLVRLVWSGEDRE